MKGHGFDRPDPAYDPFEVIVEALDAHCVTPGCRTRNKALAAVADVAERLRQARGEDVAGQLASLQEMYDEATEMLEATREQLLEALARESKIKALFADGE
jgi:hypothetical protein